MNQDEFYFEKEESKFLLKKQKQFNQKLKKKRVKIEHVIGFFKRFKVFSTKYRNRRLGFSLRMSLIAGMFNYMGGL